MKMNFLFVILILAILVAALFGSHFFIYFSLIKFLNISAINAKIWLAVIIFILAVSFILSSALAHYSENIFSNMLYFSSGLWLGIAVNLIVAFFVSWFIIGLARMTGYQFDHRYLAILSVVFAIFYTSYGVWNAYHPEIKDITVKINNLPEAWKGKTAVQLSDIHLGHILGKKFLSGVVQKVNAQKPDIVFITGDLFDGMNGQLDNLVRPLDDISAPLGSYFVTGNHETYLGVSKALAALNKTPVKVLHDQMVNIDGMQILGVSYPERGENKNIEETVKNISGFNPNDPSILLYHNPAQEAQAKASGVNLQLAGHTHGGSQLFPLQIITRLIYGKYYYGLFQEGNFSIYTSAGVGTWGPTVRTNEAPEIVVIHFE